MGHYLSEMQSDPVETSEYKKWKKEFPPLREKVANIPMLGMLAGDISDVLFVLGLSSRAREGGCIYRPILLPPEGAEKATDAANRLIKKYC